MKNPGGKKILFCIAILLAVLCLCAAASASIVKSGSCGPNATYTLDDTGLLTVTGTGEISEKPWENFRSEVKKISITQVHGICADAFEGLQDVTSVSISDVGTIGEYAFMDCRALATVQLSGVQKIDSFAFAYCTSLTSFTLPASTTEVGSGIVKDCTSLAAINVASGNPSYVSDGGILFSADRTCLKEYPCGKAGAEYSVPAGVTDVEHYAFTGSRLQKITFPDSMTGIGADICCMAEHLTTVVLPETIEYIGEVSFSGCIHLTDINIPNSVTTLHWRCFALCDALRTLTVPYTVTDIREDVFAESTNLTIRGYTGSAIETYCQNNNIPFEAIGSMPLEKDISACEISRIKDAVYTGSAIKPKVTVKHNGEKLVKGTDYTVTYKNNKAVGKAVVIIKGKGDYTGEKEVTFRINPKAVKLSSVTAGKKKLTVAWEQGEGIKGYEIEYGQKKDFSDAQKVSVSKAKTVEKTIKKLKSGKKYYVRIRTWKKVKGETYYSAWSKAKSVKVK